jgi:N-acetylneuraminic acid mutarotase
MLIAMACLGGSLWAQNIWTQKASYPGSNTITATTFVIEGKAYVFNSLGSSTNTLWEYDPVSNMWSERAGLDIIKMERAVSFSIGNIGYVGTGNSGAGSQTNMFFAYDHTTNIWTQKASMPGVGRSGAIGFSIGNKGYIGGGYIGSNAFTNSFYEYDPTSDSWSEKEDLPGIRVDAGVFTTGGRGYMFGGRSSSSVYHNTMWAYDPPTDSWIPCSDFPANPRIRPVGFSIGGQGFMGTGYDQSNSLSDFYEYSPATDLWVQRANVGGGGRHWATSFAINGKGYIGLGLNNGSLYEYLPELTTGFAPTFHSVELKLYPNPCTGMIIIEPGELPGRAVQISLYDMVGQLVSRTGRALSPIIQEDLSHLPNGTYIMVIQNEHHAMHGKVVIER